jgi:hypothetical protein
MKTITINILPTVEANRDQQILEELGIVSVVVPHFKSPSSYVGDSMFSELVVREDQAARAREILGLNSPEIES